MILEGEIRIQKCAVFLSDFQTVIKYLSPLYFLYELFMSLRSLFSTFYSLMQPIATETYTCIFPKVQNVGTECLRTLYFTSPGYRRKYLSRHLLQRCRVWAEISASASYLLMLDMGGNFRLHFFTIARCG